MPPAFDFRGVSMETRCDLCTLWVPSVPLQMAERCWWITDLRRTVAEVRRRHFIYYAELFCSQSSFAPTPAPTRITSSGLRPQPEWCQEVCPPQPEQCQEVWVCPEPEQCQEVWVCPPTQTVSRGLPPPTRTVSRGWPPQYEKCQKVCHPPPNRIRNRQYCAM